MKKTPAQRFNPPLAAMHTTHQHPAPTAWKRLVVWSLVTIFVPCGLLHLGAAKPARKAASQVVWEPGPRGSVGADIMNVPSAVRYLRQEKPAFIGIGNSMLFSRLGRTPDEITKLTGQPFVFLLKAGSSSAIWYMLLKNVVAASGAKPKAVFLFVRDDELTAPLTESESNDSPFLRSLRGEHEPELDRLMGVSEHKPINRPINRLKDWFTFDEWRDEASGRLVNMAMDIGGRGMPKKAQRFVMNERFSIEHFRDDVKADKAAGGSKTASAQPDDFAGTPLDEMLKVAQKQSLRLFVVRIKRRPNAEGIVADDAPGMPAYAAKLKTVIEQRGGVLLDETYDSTIRLTDYKDGDHIRSERQDWYRNYFWKRVSHLLP